MIKTCYIISCCKDRAQNYTDIQLKNVEVVHFDAIDTRDDPYKVCHDNGYLIDIKHNTPHFNRLSGAFGCWMSHETIWNKIIDNNDNDYYCVVEDDANPDHVMNFLASDYKPEKPIVNLNYRGRPEMHAVHPKHIGYGSEAYVLNRQGAQLLTMVSGKTISSPVDKFIFKHTRELFPYMFAHDAKIDLAGWCNKTTMKPK